MPDLLPAEQLAQANALDQFVRPLALRLGRPGARRRARRRRRRRRGVRARRGSFARLGAAMLLPCAARAHRAPSAAGSMLADLRDGLRPTCAARVWLWGTFASAAIAYLLFMGPAEVLLPFVVKHDLGGSAARPRPGLRRRRPRLGRLRRGDGPARPAAARA